MVLRKLFFLIALVGVSCSETPDELLTGTALEKGEQLYQIHCLRCHGSDGNKGASGAKQLEKSKFSRNQIIDIIKNGKGVMPSFKNTIKGDSSFIWLAEYVETLKK
ncbi:cytochrome c [Crocinitomicaceae bacterium]|nr:cytochrome c [Crocinitomicaceae bacterium]